MQDLIIISPIYKPTNIPAMYHSVEECAKSIRIIWIPIFDKICSTEGEDWRYKFMNNKNQNLLINCMVSEYEDISGGYMHKNYILDLLEDQDQFDNLQNHWIYFLNNNNILHQGLVGYLSSGEEALKEYNGFKFFQTTSNGVRVEKFDICFRLKSVKGVRYTFAEDPILRFNKSWNKSNYKLDEDEQALIPQFYLEHNVLSYFNYLE